MEFNINNNKIQLKILKADESDTIALIGNWYKDEWQIDTQTALQILTRVSSSVNEFQIVMYLNDKAIGTAGVYQNVGIHKHIERLTKFPNWLALVYTIPEERKKGYGEIMCKYVEEIAKNFNMKELHLFTDTAERLYKRIGWNEMERVTLSNRELVIMNKII